jgi:uncharacterized protein with PIN domain
VKGERLCHFRFYAELNDFLPPQRRGVAFPHRFVDAASVKDMIESLGAPHTEVDLILVNGVSVDFSYLVRDGDRISVYPVFEGLDITPILRIRPKPLRETRFVLDVHLGRLARYLRMLGFDALYRNNYGDEELAGISSGEQRILLTRDVGLLKRTVVTHGYLVRETGPQRQAAEVVQRFDLRRSIRPFVRCLRCNASLERVEKAQAVARVAWRTIENYDEFQACLGCGRIYWRGGHYRRMRKFLQSLGYDVGHG